MTSASSNRFWSIAIASGLVAGLLAWAVGEVTREAFRPRTFQTEILGRPYIQPTMGSQNAADYKNAALAYAILGGATGLLLGLAGGLTSRSASRGIVFGGLGLLVGFLAAGLGSLAIVRLHYRGFVPNPNDLVTPILIHAGISTIVGEVGGAALALGAGLRHRVLNAVLGAWIGAMLATFLFHLLGEGFFSNSGYAEPIAATSPVRLLSRTLVTVLAAAGAAWEITRPRPLEKPAASPTDGQPS